MAAFKGGLNSATSGITVQASRFAIIAPESDSDEHENDWIGVSSKKHSKGSKKPNKAVQNQKDCVGKAATKNAKRRAKKRDKLDSSSHEQFADNNQKYSDWLEKDSTLVDKEFERNLEIALVNSLTEKNRDKPHHQEQVPEEITEKTKPNKSKKGITLSLQDFHSSGFSPIVTSRDNEQHNGENETDEQFFKCVEKDVKKEVQKSKEIDRQAKMKKSSKKSNDSNSAEESVRIAHLKNEVEQRDGIVTKLKEDNNHLMQELKEAKKRNQVLCKMLGTGEISSKSELLQQLEELTIVKNELSQEVEKLHSELEQERSKNKLLKTELSSKGTYTKH